MDNKKFGRMIFNQRKKLELTQEELAAKLHVSGKAVSKWESGAGYPEITLLEPLSNIFGVPIDYLIKGNPKGIAVAGNIIVDILNVIEKYPEKGMLTNISATSYAVGGCVPNTIIDLAKIDSELLLTAYGRVGNDEYGRYATKQLKKYGVDTSKIIVSSDGLTSTDLVMTEMTSRERTFFYSSGANSSFSESDIDISSLECEIFHIGYLMLLDALDQEDETYGTKLARILCNVQKKGIKTSIDVVSRENKKFAETIIPALKYCNYVIMNEIECCKVSGLSPRNDDGSINFENIKKTMAVFMENGVSDKVIIHFSEGGICLNSTGEFTFVPSLLLPKGYIKGSVGAGDAFAAASLYGIYKGFDDKKILEFASAAAACNLAEEDSISGMKSAAEIKEMCKLYRRRTEL